MKQSAEEMQLLPLFEPLGLSAGALGWRARGNFAAHQSRFSRAKPPAAALSPAGGCFPLALLFFLWGGEQPVFSFFSSERCKLFVGCPPSSSLGLHQASHDWYFEMDPSIYTLLRLPACKAVMRNASLCCIPAAEQLPSGRGFSRPSLPPS